MSAPPVSPPAAEIQRLMQDFSRSRYDEVIAVSADWMRRYPAYAFGWIAQGTALHRAGRSHEAIAPLQQATALAPADASAHNNLGNVQKSLRRYDQAEASYRRALQANPHYAEAHYNLALCALERDDLVAAETGCRRALAIKPELAEAHTNLAAILDEQGRLIEAEASCRQAIALRPELAEAHHGLGNILKNQGRIADAVTSYRCALALQPDHLSAHSNLLLCLNYAALDSPAACAAEAARYGELLRLQARSTYTAWHCTPQATPLRVGLVSGELWSHPVGYFLEGVLAQIDKSRLELVAFPSHPRRDALTDRIRPHFAAWKPVNALNDDDAARLIHDEGIHILVDLAGHTRHNRLPVFARKPAPVQVSWLGYFATTGLPQIDYLLADPAAVPPEHTSHFTEQIWYAPDTRLCFTPPPDAPPVAPPPCRRSGHITFGCYQNLAKLSDDVLDCWAAILAAVPASRLRLQTRPLGYPHDRQLLGQRMQARGIDVARLSMHGEMPRNAYLDSHAEVDLILDTFPFPGGTTTCEALWMGVPTLTLAGDRMLSRQGASLLHAAGLAAWIASSREEYITRAIALARDQDRLAGLRASLREQVRTSALCDAARFAVQFEIALGGMWQRYRQQQAGGAPSPAI